MYRKFFITIASLLLTAGLAAQDNATELWNKAGEAYAAGDYAAAAAGYDSLVTLGFSGDRLYYNLGNALFKSDRLGEAILYYNKAQKLAPADGDIEYNLRIANTFVKDRIESVPEFFLTKWMRSLRGGFSSNEWAALSLLFFGAMLAFAAVYLLVKRTGVRKAGFFGGVLFLILFIISVSFSSAGRSEMVDPREAVILLSAAPVKSSPDGGSKDIFVLHEGTKVRITDSFGQWREIMIADGNKGWIEARAIGLID